LGIDGNRFQAMPKNLPALGEYSFVVLAEMTPNVVLV